MMRGVVLAGGKGTRLGELTRVTNKHLLPVGDLPMVYYPLKKLIGAGIRDILLVTGTEHMGAFVNLLGSGSSLGCSLTYRVQDEAGGIAQALSLARHHAASSRVCVVLGDNVWRDPLPSYVASGDALDASSAYVFLKQVTDPQRYGVATINLSTRKIVQIREKPSIPEIGNMDLALQSNFAVAGIYVYPPDVFDVIDTLKPSARGELEITDVNLHYLRRGRLDYTGLAGWWTDAGTHESLALANRMVREDPPLW